MSKQNMGEFMSIRFTYFIGFVIACLILAISLYLQLVEGILPCPLCTLQRFIFVLLALFLLIGVLGASIRWSRLVIDGLSALSSILGIVLAGRQVWLQHFSTGNAECGVSLNYMLQVLPLHQVLQKVFAGSAECTQRGWEFLSINMAEWALIFFVGFLALSGYLFYQEFKSPPPK